MSRWALSLTTWLTVAGCAAAPVTTVWQPPAGAVPVSTSAGPRSYDFTGIKSVTVNGRTMSPDVALQTMNYNFAVALGQVAPEGNPLSGRARIVLPDHDRLRLLSPANSSSGLINFKAEEMRLGLHALADVIVRSQVFTNVDLVEQNDTVVPDAGGADYLIWFQVRSLGVNNTGPWIGHWQMKRAHSDAADPIGVDPGTQAGIPRMLSFVSSIRLAASHLNGAPVARATARPETGGHGVSVGTGIVIDAAGHVLTNNHVIARCPDMRVADAEGTDAGGTLIATDTFDDLALLKTDRHWSSWARFRESSTLRPGEPLVVTGYPLSGLVSPEMAVTTGSLTALGGLRGDARQLQFSAPIQPGNSGGPVLDDSGKVVGVASSILNGLALASVTGALPQNVNFAIKADTARTFLADNEVTLDFAAGRQASGPAAVGDLARKFTVKITCVR